MVKIGKFFGYVIFFILALMYFMPKESIYYFAEKELKNYNVIIAHEAVKDSGFSLELKHLDIYVEAIESAKVDSVSISLFGVYNTIDANNVHLTEALSSMLPVKIDKVNIRYSIFHPTEITLNAVGAFGTIDAKANLIERKVDALLKPSSIMKRKYRSTLRNFKKQSNGEYEYVQSF
jgi:hypothetical protein